MSFSQEVKENLFVACNRHCCICHKPAGNKMEVHHIVPKSEGGENTEENGIPLCFDCHAEVASYNPKHPKGNKFYPSELKRHKEEWFKRCKMNPWHSDGSGTQIVQEASTNYGEEIKKSNPSIERYANIATGFEMLDHILTTEYKEELSNARDLIKNYKPNAALEVLKKLKNRIWGNAKEIVKYEILTYTGFAKLNMNETTEAAQCFISALKYNKEYEKAICNAALGYLILENPEKSIKCANKILKENPANADANSIIIQASSDEENLEEIILKVKEQYRNSKEVTHAIGFQARKRNILDEAERWLRISLENDKKSPDLNGDLGEVLLQMLIDDPIIIYTNQLNDLKRKTAEEAKNRLNNAWKSVSGTEMEKFRLNWLINCSGTKRILGDLEGAISDLTIALNIDPSDPIIKKNMAILTFEDGNKKKAKKILNNIINNPKTPDASILLANILGSEGNYKDAIKVVNNFLKMDSSKKFQDQVYKLLIELYINSRDQENASKIYSLLYGTGYKDIFSIVDATRISKLSNEGNALFLLKKAKEMINSSSNPRELLNLGNEFYSSGKLEDAAEIYEKITDKSLNSDLTHRLVDIYYRTGEIGKAFKICKSLREKYGHPLEYISEIEVLICAEIEDYEEAKKICKSYLKLYPDDLEMKIHQTKINLHSNDFQEIDKFLNSQIDFNSISLESGLQLAYLYSIRNLNQKAFEIMYELRRKHSNHADIHSKYINFFFQREKGNEDWLNPEKVCNNSAVLIENDSGQKRWYILENRKNSKINCGEIDLKSPIAKRLMNKSVGDLIVNKNDFSERTIKIVKITSKYLYACHESVYLVDLFPDIDGIWPINIGEAKKEGEPPEGIQIFLKEIERQKDNHDIIENFYKNGKITIGVFAEYTNRNILNSLGNLIKRPDLGVRCCIGNIKETHNALFLLNSKPNLVIDIVSLMTIHYIDVQEIILKAFKLVIAQSTIDLLQNIIKEYKSCKEGFMTAWKEGDEFAREEIKSEDIKAHIHYLENILIWINKNCKVSPCKVALDINRNRRQQYDSTMGKSFVDTILISKESGNLLYSDDEILRSLAANEFKIKSVWIQPILLHCLKEKVIDRTEYNELIIKLMLLNYNVLIINGDLILQSAEKSNWLPISPYSTILNKIISYNPVELARALSNFAFELFNKDIPNERKDYLINYSLSIISSNENRLNVLYLLSREMTFTINDKYLDFINGSVEQ